MTTYIYPALPTVSLPPVGAATEAQQLLMNASLDAIESETVLAAKQPVYRDCSVDSITTVAWADLVTTISDIKEIQIVGNGGGYFYLKDEDSGAELAVVPAGFTGNIKIDVPSGKKLQAKAIDSNITSGKITITLLG